MKNTYKTILLICVMGLQYLNAQDPEFSQFWANPLHLNPALAGINNCPRITLNSRYQWPGLSGTFLTNSFGYDQRIMDEVGIGVQLDSDDAGRGTLKTNQLHLIYAYHQLINKNFSFSIGLQGSYRNKFVDKSKLILPDQIDPIYGVSLNTQEDLSRLQPANLVDFSTGILIYGKGMYLGGSTHHLFEPNESIKGGESKLPRKYSVHGGLKIKKDKYSSWSPNFIYRAQQDFRYLFLGMYYQHQTLTFGCWYRNLDAFIVLLGLDLDEFSIGYSYDATISKLSFNTGGASELSVKYKFNCKPKSPKFRNNDCPSF